MFCVNCVSLKCHCCKADYMTLPLDIALLLSRENDANLETAQQESMWETVMRAWWEAAEC